MTRRLISFAVVVSLELLLLILLLPDNILPSSSFVVPPPPAPSGTRRRRLTTRGAGDNSCLGAATGGSTRRVVDDAGVKGRDLAMMMTTTTTIIADENGNEGDEDDREDCYSSRSSPTTTAATRYSRHRRHRHHHDISRAAAIRSFAVVTSVVLSLWPSAVRADVASGDLPEGAAQFARVLRLKSDIKKVRARVAEAAELDKKEWDNVGNFLRAVYSTTNDMEAIAKGIYDPSKQKRALEDCSQLKKYAQVADVPVNKRDGPAFVTVADKMSPLVDDFLDSLSDVPDEI